MAATLETILTKVRRYNPEADAGLLRRAYDYAADKHADQKRRTGEPYIQHPLEVVDILTGLDMDTPSLAAGFLHDVIEDCGVSREELAGVFGDEIAGLVDGVTKLKLADFERRDPEAAQAAQAARAAQAAEAEKDSADKAAGETRRKKRLETRNSADNLRKILLAMARDFRVMVIKLGDRLHNMRTLNGLPEERRKKVAAETMQIFAPLAHRLGIWQIKWQLEDLAFKYLYPDEYQDLTEKVARTRREREKDIKDAVFRMKGAFESAGLDAEIQGRPKHLWSVYNKMRKQELDFNEIYDLIALRVITHTVAECYTALGIVHDLWLPIPGKFDDYIAKRKSNLYQSLHTKIYGPRGEPLEIQIRTWEMHRVAEFGVAAHWAYKEQGEQARAGAGRAAVAGFDRKMAFLRQQLFEWQQDTKDPSEFLRLVASDLFADQVFVFTPKGDVIDLPAGATPVDFAFRIHTELGEHCANAKVNGRIVPLSYQFRNGDICSVGARPSANPSLDWLAFVKTGHARGKIKSHFRKLRYADNVVRGRDLLTEEAARAGIPAEIVRDAKRLLEIAHAVNKETVDDLYAAIGFGDTALGVVINRLRPAPTEHDEGEVKIGRKPTGQGKLSIAPGGVDDVAIARARCCLPLPGDDVVGYVSRGKGMLLHREGCNNVAQWRKTESERLVEVDWEAADGARFETGILFETLDRVGLLRDVTEVFSENRTNILGITTRSSKTAGTAVLRIDFESPSVEHVETMIRRLRNLEDLLWVHRLGVGAEEPPQPTRNVA